MYKLYDHRGNSITKGVSDATWGQGNAQNAMAPKVMKQIIKSLTPTESWELCSAVRAAVSARNTSIPSVRIRLFDKKHREVLGGKAFNFLKKPNPCQSGPKFLQEIAFWSDIAGERAVYLHQDPRFGFVGHVLNPISMRVIQPSLPSLPENIVTWQYYWENGLLQQISASDIYFSHDLNPSSKVRGNSPLLAVVNSITSYNEAQKYIRSFFTNSAKPNGIVSIENTDPDSAESFKKEFLSDLQGSENAWRTWFTNGKTSFTSLEQPIHDSPFAILLTQIRDEVAALYKVPPLHGGMWDKTRFDSVDAQNRYFYEAVFIPELEDKQQFLQGLIDEHFTFSAIEDAHDTHISKDIHDRIDIVKDYTTSNFVVILDADHIPAVAELKEKKFKLAMSMRNVLAMTPNQAAISAGLDYPRTDAGDLTWFPTDQKFMEKTREGQVTITPNAVARDKTNTVPAEHPVVKPTNISPANLVSDEPVAQNERDLNQPEVSNTENNSGSNIDHSVSTFQPEVPYSEDRHVAITNQDPKDIHQTHPKMKQIKEFYRQLRRLSMVKASEGSIWSIAEADALANTLEVAEEVKKEIRKDYRKVAKLTKEKSSEEVKSFFREKDKSIKKIFQMEKK